MSSNGTFSPPSSGSKLHINPSVLVIVVVLSVVLVCSGVLHLLARWLGRRHALAPPALTLSLGGAASNNSLRGQLQHLFQLHDAGVDQAFIDTLPVFQYGTIRGLKDGADCAVCLSEFGEEDRLRLLPKCKHAFHLECIDTWLLSNSTCPLCRQSLLAGDSLRSTSSSRARAREPQSLLPTDTATTTTSSAGTCAQAFVEVDETDLRERASSRGSSFRTCDHHPDSGTNLEIEIVAANTHLDRDSSHAALDHDPDASPMTGPTVCVTEADGSERVMRVALGKVKFDSRGSSYHGMSSNGFESATTSTAGSRPDRSYSMGSYQYIVDSSSFELTIAPTPYPGRPQRHWGTTAAAAAAASKPTHRTVLSDSIPELAGGGAGDTPANENFFWASRGLNTPNSLSHAREMLTPSPARTFPISPSPPPAFQESLYRHQAAAAAAAVSALQGSIHSSRGVEAQDQQQQCSSIRDTTNREESYEDHESFTMGSDELHDESQGITLLRRKRGPSAPLLQQEYSSSSQPINSIISQKNNQLPTTTTSVLAADFEIKELGDVGAAQRTSSLRLPGRDENAATNVRWFRRSLSDQTTGLGLGLGLALREGYGGDDNHCAAAASVVLQIPSSVTSTAHHLPVSTSLRKLSTLNWLMGRGRRLVYSATTPSPLMMTVAQTDKELGNNCQHC